jgi:ribosomal protein S18 acetylase RimI-like enzyme
MRPLHATVRFALESDAIALANMRWASRSASERATEALETFAPRFVDWLRLALRSEEWQVVVAHANDGQIQGCMYLRIVETVPVPGVGGRAWGYVTHAYVDEQVRGGGIGTALLDALIQRSKALRLHELHVWPSSAAVSLYERAGFQSPEAQRTSGEEPSYVLPLPAR